MSGNAVPRAVDEAADDEGRRRRSSALVWRLAAGGVLALALSVYAAVVDQLPNLPLWGDVLLASCALIPATLALAWLALPLRTWDGAAAAGIALVTLALACTVAGLDVAANLTKALAVVLLALVFVGFFERAWWVGAVALLIPLVDALSVWRGPTRHIVTERPGVFDVLSVSFPVPPDGAFKLGLPDVLFFALFLGAAARWHMRVGLAWVLMTASFGGTMAIALWVDPFGLGGLPALPLLSLAFLLANGDLLLRSLRPEPEEPVRYLRALPDPEPPPQPRRVAGIAADDEGWVVAGLVEGRFEWSHRAATLEEAVAVAGEVDALGVESVGAESRREAMAERLYLGPPARRVYLEFLGELLETRDEDEAAALCRILGWDGITRESLAFRRQALDVARHRGDARLVEIEPVELPAPGAETPAAARRAVAVALAATDSAPRR